MPFYGDSGAGFRPAAGFGNAVWHQGVSPVGTVTVEAAPGAWPPQQFIQQIPAPNQLEELRYHPQYSAATPYHPQPGNFYLVNSHFNFFSMSNNAYSLHVGMVFHSVLSVIIKELIKRFLVNLNALVKPKHMFTCLMYTECSK